MKMRAMLLPLCVALLAPAPRPTAEAGATSFMLAVLRRDGVVVPFAAFNGRRWSEPWPDTLPHEIPISLDNVPDRWWGIEPPPRRLQLWKDGARAGEIALTGLTITNLMCEPRLVLRSDHRTTAPVPPQFVLPYPKDGLLVAGEAQVGTVGMVAPDGEEAQRVLKFAASEFNRQENIAAGAFTDWRHPVKASQRKLVPITIEALYRAPMDDAGWTAYFMEAVRQYPPEPGAKDTCGISTYASGWVNVSAKGRARVKVTARVTYCDRKGVGYMLPLGLVQARDRAYWVFQHSGFEYESYEVMRPTSRGADSEVAFTAGVCGR